MYIEIVPNRNSRPAILLREGWREGKKVCKRTLANLTDWPAQKVAALRRVLKDEPLVSPQEAFAIERSWPHGHVEAVLETIQHIGLDKLIGAKRSRERDWVLAMIVERLIAPCSKLATTRMWHSTTLAQLLQVLYDVSSSYYEGHTCPLVRFGHSRDSKRGKPILVYGVLTDVQGRPVAVQVYPGNTGDPSAVADQVEKLKGRFALERVVLVGDRGMLTQTQIEVLKAHPGIGWVSALRSEKVRQLLDAEHLQLSLFDERNLAEIHSTDFPDERLVACFNPLLAEERKRKRHELLDATELLLEKIRMQVRRRTKTPLSAAQIGQKVGKVINRHKVGKHFEVSIADGHFSFSRRTEAIAHEAELYGLYVIRTSEPQQALSAHDTVRSYKNLAQVERAFRTLKGMDLRIRPIHHRGEERVRAHIFLCLLAYYVEWHMRQALCALLFDDETPPIERKQRDPVAPAKPSASARRKKTERETEDGFPIHSFATLMAELGTRCRHLCRLKSDADSPAFFQDTLPTPLQVRALELIRLFPVSGS